MLQQNTENNRYIKGKINSWIVNFFHLRNPYVIAWWSAAFPGFGHISMGNYAIGFLLFFWELLINTKANLNIAILYSFTGRFQMAKEIVDKRWLLLYAPVYIFTIWDSYQRVLKYNQVSVLADRAGETVAPASVSFIEINITGKHSPWMAAAWSLLCPGFGHIYTQRLPGGVFLIAWWIFLCYQSGLLLGMQYTALGLFEEAKLMLDPQWLMDIPSIYGFCTYDAYIKAVECNRLFEKEQAAYLRKNYQEAGFSMPTQTGAAMYVVAAFEHSIKLELAISELLQNGIVKERICAVPMNMLQQEGYRLDTIHRADGLSVFDVPAILGSIFMLFGVMWGFMWNWGPIIWGLIGLFTGAGLGFAFKYFHYKLYKRKQPKNGKIAEVILIVGCDEAGSKIVETVVSSHSALSVGRVGQ